MPSKKLPGQDMADLINKINQPLASLDRMAELGRRITQGLEGYRLAIQPDLAVLLEDRFRLPATELGRAFAAIAPPPLSEAMRGQFTSQLNELSKSVAQLSTPWLELSAKVPVTSQLTELFTAQMPSADVLTRMADALKGITAEALGADAFRDSTAMERVQAHAAAIASPAQADDAAAPDDAMAGLAADMEEVFAAAQTPEERVFSRVYVLQQLIGAAIQYGPAVAEKLWPHIRALYIVLFMALATPEAPASPPLALPAPVAKDAGALEIPGGWQVEGLPEVIRRAGPQAERVTVEFFTAHIRNRNTRQAYAHAAMRFFTWCEERNLELVDITPFAVAAYVEELQREASAPTVKQHLAGIRMLFDALVVGQVLPMNPAASVRGPKHVVKRGRTPVLAAQEARALLDAIDTGTLAGLRDRALIGVMVYSFARVSAAVTMRVEDYYPAGKRWWLRLHEKGGKRHDVPAHHNAEAYLDAYLEAAGIREEKRGPLFRSLGRDRQLTRNPMHRVDVLRMVKRRALAAGLPASTCCHTFRATGITAYLENGGTIEKAQQIAAHESPRTTKLYDRTADELTLDEIERILI